MNLEKILKHIIVDEATGCWIWQKSCNSAGYGQLTENGKYWLAHRYSFTCVKGEINPGLLLRHTCHNTKCCNPEHVIQGTNLENYYDSLENHKAADAKRRSKWSVNGKEYSTCKEVVAQLGLSMSSVIKYTKEGVFDVESYRKACYTARVIPKV